MRYERILSRVFETVWAVHPAKLSEILNVLAIRAAGEEIPEATIQAVVAARPQSPGVRTTGAIAVLPITGTLFHRGDMIKEASGSASLEQLSGQFAAIIRDPSIHAVVLDFDTPGGDVKGVSEFAAEIRAARNIKPVISLCNSMAASAGFWLASNASEVSAIPSAEIGSLGVLTAHTNIARALDQKGIDTTVIHAGKFKAETLPLGPLTPEARAFIQARVDTIYARLIQDVATGRRTTPANVAMNYGEGRVLGADQALRAGMIDRIETMDTLLARLGRQVTRTPGVPGAAFGALPSRPSTVSKRMAPLDSESRKRRLLLAEAQAAGHTMTPARDLTDLERRRRRLAAAAR